MIPSRKDRGGPGFPLPFRRGRPAQTKTGGARRGPARSQRPEKTRWSGQTPMEAMSTFTPGPMVELSETFFT